jgi:hypothetical protein
MPDPASPAPHPSDLRLELGHVIVAFMEPHRGHEHAWNRWYERDHFLALCAAAPWTFSSARFIATKREKALRTPRANPISDPPERGSFLGCAFIQRGRYEDQQRWVGEQMAIHAEHGRLFDHRDVVTTAAYDLVGCARRDADGVPPELALEHRYAGLALLWTERHPSVSLGAYRAWLETQLLPGALEKTELALALLLAPKAKPDFWPKAAPEVPGVGERILIACFTEAPPAQCFEKRIAPLGGAISAGGRGRLLFAAPFVPTKPGVDPALDEIY